VRAALCLVGAALLAVPLSAGVRNLTGLPVAESLVVAVSLALVLCLGTLPLQRRGEPRSPQLWVAGCAFAAVAFGFAFSELYNPFFAGLPAMTGGDGGNHLRNQAAFVAFGTRYTGMDALYATAHWLEILFRLDAFASYRAAFYAVVAATVLFLTASGFALVPSSARPDARLAWGTFALMVAVAYLPARGFLLPLLHYYQADGYFSQLFGLIPLFLTILLYAASRSRLSRLLALGLGVFFCRYTYLLNIADLVATGGLLLAGEAATGRLARPRRRALLLVAGLAAAVAGYLYARLYAILPDPGGFRPPVTVLAAWGVLLASAVQVAAPLLLRDTLLALPAAGARLLHFSGVFGLVSVSVQALWRVTEQDPGTYYYYKYGFSAVVVTSSVGIAFVAWTLARLVAAGRRVRGIGSRALVATSAALAVTALGFGLLSRAHAVYRPSYAERARGAPPWRHLDPLADRRAWAIIDAVLRETGHRFGGMITPRWPESSFANGRFGLPHEPIYWNGEFERGGRRCVFWYGLEHPLPRAYGGHTPRVRTVLERLEARPGRRCHRYSPEHVPGEPGMLCHLCYRDDAGR
jgi:hypothetical protein